MAKKKKMSIKELMEKHVGHVKANHKLAKEIRNYKNVWVSNNSSFLSGGLIGVENINFKSETVNKFMLDILDTIPENIQADIKNTEVIQPSWKIVSDPFNLSLFYLIHLFYNSSMSDISKTRAVKDLLELYFLRTLAAIHSKSFTTLNTYGLAKATFESLSNRFLIKKLGSWSKVIEHFVETTLETKYVDVVKKYTDSEEIKNMMSYTNRRMASTIGEVRKVFYEMIEKGENLKTSGGTVSIGDEDHLKEVINNPEVRIDKVIRKSIDDSDWLNRDIKDLAMELSPSLVESQFINLLKKFQKDHLSKTVERIIRTNCIVINNYLTKNGLYDKSTMDILKAAKGILISSRSPDRELIKLRDDVDKYIKKKMDRRISEQAKISLRLGLLLYIFIMFLTVK